MISANRPLRREPDSHAMTYIARLHANIRRTGTPALVGLDPRWDSLPTALREKALDTAGNSFEAHALAFEEFSRRIIDVVAPLVPAVKPQAAFFEACGPAGVAALQRVCRYARDAGLIVIMDAKRGDIGSTAEAYAAAHLAGADADAAPFPADALTVNPYLGADTLEPFINRSREVDAGIYVLVRTSNPGSSSFQDRTQDGAKVFEVVADLLQAINATGELTDGYGPVGAVVGATYPEELKELRDRMPSTPLLIPGYGSQGGTAKDVAAAFDTNGLGGLVNSSRGIIFAYAKGPLAEQFGESKWEQAVEAATLAMIADLKTAIGV